MNIKATEHRHYSNKDYRIASDLPNNRQVAERKDCVDILGESGEVINSSAGSNVDTNIRGDVFWTEGDEIQKWSEAEGEQSVAKGYRGFIPGPDGKLFALGFDREAARQTVELLDEKGNTGGKALLPEQFKITGAYTNQDQSRVLLGGWSEAYFDVYTRPATLFALEVSDEGALKMEAVRRDNLNALSVKDYQPIILEDGREGVVTQMELKLGSRSESHEGAWSLLGYGAAPGGRPVDPFGSDLPANTLSEQLSQLFSSNEKTGSSSPGVPVWSKMEPRNPDLVDVSPPPTCREVEPEKKLWHPSLALKAGSGGAGLAAGAALLAVGLGPVGLGVAAAGLLGGVLCDFSLQPLNRISCGGSHY